MPEKDNSAPPKDPSGRKTTSRVKGTHRQASIFAHSSVLSTQSSLLLTPKYWKSNAKHSNYVSEDKNYTAGFDNETSFKIDAGPAIRARLPAMPLLAVL